MSNEELRRTVELLMRYGDAKFGDEWWPSNAAGWIGNANAAELSGLLERLPVT